MQDDEFALRDHDERDEAERLEQPPEWEPLFEATPLDVAAAPAAGTLAFQW